MLDSEQTNLPSTNGVESSESLPLNDSERSHDATLSGTLANSASNPHNASTRANLIDETAQVSTSKPASNGLPMVPGEMKAQSSFFGPLSRPGSPMETITIQQILQDGVPMLKVSAKKVQQRMIRLAPEQGQILWESRTGGVINIENIIELRFGNETKAFREQLGLSIDSQSLWTTIIYSGYAKRIKTLHLVALTPQILELWKEALTLLYQQRRSLMGGLDQMRVRQSVWLRQQWKTADSNDNERLQFDEVVRLCKRLGIAAQRQDLEKNFKAADVNNRGELDFGNFQIFVRLLKRRPEVENLFSDLSNGKEVLDLQQFSNFIINCQKSTLSESSLEDLYRKFSDYTLGAMTSEGFSSFLLSSDNSASSEFQAKPQMDMTRPLCEYYVSSSHNTYLVGNQIKGSSTVEGYVRALQQGCRCVELDVWDGSDEPVIYHGRTLTSKISAREALTAISRYAFVASPYPLILSLEMHCGAAQHDKLAMIMRETLGSALLDRTIDDVEFNTLPSPEQLRFKILIKGKNPVEKFSKKTEKDSESDSTETSSSTSSDSEMKWSSITNALRRFRPRTNSSGEIPTLSKIISHPIPMPPSRVTSEGPPQLSNRTPSSSYTPTPNERCEEEIKWGHSHAESHSKSNHHNSSRSEPSAVSITKPKIPFEFAGLLVYTTGVKWRGFNKKESYEPTDIISLGERTANKVVKEAKPDLIAHTRTHIMRVYPSGARFTSSNYLPHHLWAFGIQLVAINWQTFDLGAEINSAFFSRNGRSGYILKPKPLRIKGDIKDKDFVSKSESYILDIEIISAQQLTRPRSKEDKTTSEENSIDPYVEITILIPGVLPTSPPKRKTSAIIGNGFNPRFNAKWSIKFEVFGNLLDLAFLHFKVGDERDSDKILGKYCIGINTLQSGYRHVPLYDHLGQQYLFSSLFIKTDIRLAS